MSLDAKIRQETQGTHQLQNIAEYEKELQSVSALTQRVAAVEESQTEGVEPLGNWDASTNTPALSESSVGMPVGSFYDNTKKGVATFAGLNFAVGDSWAPGDKIKAFANKWYRIPFGVSEGSILLEMMERRVSELLAFLLKSVEEGRDGGWNFTDDDGYIGAALTAQGLFQVLELFVKGGITAQSFNKVAFKATDEYMQLLTDNLEYIGYYVDWMGRMGAQEVNTNLIKTKAMIAESGIQAASFNGVTFQKTEDFAQLLTDPLEFIGYYLDWMGRMGVQELTTKKLTLGNVSLESDALGGLIFRNRLSNEEILKVSALGEVEMKELRLKIENASDLLMAIQDKAGWIGNGFDANGKLLSGGGSSVSRPETGIRGDVEHYLMGGQSPSIGGGTGQAISTTPSEYNITFAGGPVTYLDQNADPAVIYSGFKPLKESTQESPCTGFAEMMMQLVRAEYGINPGTEEGKDKYQVLVSAPGLGNQSIAQLSKGTTNYAHMLADVTNGKRLANAQGKTYNVPAICWFQGENDASNADYAIPLVKLQKDLNEDIKAITGQTNDVKLVMYQTASFNSYNAGMVGNPIVAYAQQEAVLNPAIKNIYMAAPCYQLEYVADNVHFTPVSSKWAGAAHALAVHKIIHLGEDFKPIHVKKQVRQGNLLELQMHVPVLPLVLDTQNVTNPGNYGFRLFRPSGAEATITKVEKVRPDTILITTQNDIEAGSRLTYAANGTYPNSGPIAGTRGCLRDSEPTVFTAQGINKPLWNWTPIHKLPIL